jgi:cyclic pyranopterin phosphate synthase
VFESRHPEQGASTWIERIEHISQAVPVSKIRITGGEPLLYPEVVDVVSGCARLGIPEIALTTNGFRLAELTKPLREAGLQRINISLDSLQPETFHQITGGRLADVLEGIFAAKRAGLALKLNTVVQRGFNFEELTELLEFSAREQIHIRYLEMMPIGPAAADFDSLYVSGMEIKEQLSKLARLEPLEYVRGETSRDYRAILPDGSESLCGFILPTSTPFCDGCRRLRLDAGGRLYGCLAQPDTIPLHKAFSSADRGDFDPLQGEISRALSIKKRPQQFRQQTGMVEIGG